ncbi:MAG: ABC transporter substrate-binding protein [Anaerolineaceae bacterium]|nr:ABC transporter substrate-binding protein [Anaerolineaceae bacterium]
MKKICILILFMILMFTPVVSAQFEEVSETAAAGEEETVIPDRLTVGSSTAMEGNFFMELWDDVISDGDVRNLIHGYNFITWDSENGVFIHDPMVINAMGIRKNEEGDLTFLIALNDDLYYSDGSKITAWDYAFSYLLNIAPEINEIGGHSAKKQYLYGYDEYMDGTVSYLAGVQVLADDQIMITVKHDYLPFFYQLGLIGVTPYPISVIAPGVIVKDDGYGVYLANEDDSVSEPLFTADLLRKTILDPETGYMSHPSVTSGPYVLTGWDGVTAEFDINLYYKGNAAGKLPLIPHLTYTLVDNETMVEKLEAGEVDLLDRVTRAETVTGALQLIGKGFQMANYPRIGVAFISFNGRHPALQSKAVRQAMAWCMDRDEIIGRYTGYYGLRVDSFYGLGQWMYGIVNGTTAAPVDPPENENDLVSQAAYERELQEWDDLSLDNLTVYELDPAMADALLNKDGWKLNDDGIREKNISGETVTLSFTLIYPEGNDIYKAFEELWLPNLKACGIEVTLKAVPMTELAKQYMYPEGSDADMIYVARNFEMIYDPSAYFMTDADGNHSWFTTGIVDNDLYQYTVDMRETEPGEVMEYVKEWILAMEQFNETLPMIPIYSNVYFDIYTPILQDYYISQYETWGKAIVGSFLGEKEDFAQVFDEDEEFEEFGDFEFIDDGAGGEIILINN